jgi:hypothetical protein
MPRRNRQDQEAQELLQALLQGLREEGLDACPPKLRGLVKDLLELLVREVCKQERREEKLLTVLNQVVGNEERLKVTQGAGRKAQEEKARLRNDFIRQRLEAGIGPLEIHDSLLAEDPGLLRGHYGKTISPSEMMRLFRRSQQQNGQG